MTKGIYIGVIGSPDLRPIGLGPASPTNPDGGESVERFKLGPG